MTTLFEVLFGLSMVLLPAAVAACVVFVWGATALKRRPHREPERPTQPALAARGH